MKLAFILDPLDTLSPKKDSSYAMMREAHVRGHQLYVLQQGDIIWKGGAILGFARRLDFIDPPMNGNILSLIHISEPTRPY